MKFSKGIEMTVTKTSPAPSISVQVGITPNITTFKLNLEYLFHFCQSLPEPNKPEQSETASPQSLWQETPTKEDNHDNQLLEISLVPELPRPGDTAAPCPGAQ